jgi:hypothetical protein
VIADIGKQTFLPQIHEDPTRIFPVLIRAHPRKSAVRGFPMTVDHGDHAISPVFFPGSHITFGVIPEFMTTPLVTFQAKSRTVCINTTITCGTTTFVSQDFDVLSAKIWY